MTGRYKSVVVKCCEVGWANFSLVVAKLGNVTHTFLIVTQIPGDVCVIVVVAACVCVCVTMSGNHNNKARFNM